MTGLLIHGCEETDTPFPTIADALQKNMFVKRGDKCDLFLTATPSSVLTALSPESKGKRILGQI